MGRSQVRARASTGRHAAALAALVVSVFVVAVLVKTFLFQPFYIPSASMEPQLLVNDRVVVTKEAYALHPPHRGDIVVFVAPPSEQPTGAPSGSAAPGAGRSILQSLEGVFGVEPDRVDFVKRVVALPGDTVQAVGGHVYVNRHQLIEPYLPTGTFTASFGPVVVPRAKLWVMGDNRGDSSDSRVFGPIPESSVIGRAFARFWPPERLALL